MSTFQGFLNEIPLISIDRFDGDNLKSKLLFLSHCHTDHMQGLDLLNDESGPLYASEISTIIIKHQYPFIKSLIVLQIGVPTEISYTNQTDTYKIVVTAIPAGHCPGSVMLYFEYLDQRILYTGDFRIGLSTLNKIKHFKHNLTETIRLDAIYLDSTFLDKNFLEFPTQFDSVVQICEIISEWINKGKQYIISLKIPARYGSEYLYIEIAKKTKMKIHVNRFEYDKYCYIAEMDNTVTSHPYETQIHACVANTTKDFKTIRCRFVAEKYLRVIRPSALFWTNWNAENKLYEKHSNEIYRVCYSSHASYTEIKDMLLYLKPKQVFLNVLPDGKEKRIKINKTVDKIMNKYMNKNSDESTSQLIENFNFNNIQVSTSEIKTETSDVDSEKDDFVMDFPIKRIKR